MNVLWHVFLCGLSVSFARFAVNTQKSDCYMIHDNEKNSGKNSLFLKKHLL
jgi:hypothetical protein